MNRARAGTTMRPQRLGAVFAAALFIAPGLAPGESADELAQQLANPIADLISVPLQFNFDQNIGPQDAGERFTLNAQPVVPIPLNDEWNLISRTIVPLIRQTDIAPGTGAQSGLGDTVQSLFFSPRAPTASGWTWGVGPALLAPTATDDLLGAGQWAAGPTLVALRQQGPWTYGMLTNHLKSFAGSDNRRDINATFVQPFLAYNTPTAWTYSLNAESTYDWEARGWSAPVQLGAGKVTRIGKQTVQFVGALRYYVDSLPNGPEGLALRFNVVLLYPR